MESHQQLQHPTGIDQEGGKSSSFICRQSSSRWTPTTDQIRILKDLYYNNGIRSPSAEQIQRISAKLRQYGKIEGKNVFYWFQNHKARERQKKRFTADPTSLHRNAVWKNEDVSPLYNKFSNINSVCFPSSSPGLINVGSVGNFGNVSLAVENSFRDCSITSNCNGTSGSMAAQNSTWIGVDPYSSPYPFLENTKLYVETLEIEDDDIIAEDERSSSTLREIETLPLFPIHTANIKQQQQQQTDHDYFNGCQNHYSAASLELTLNSYAPPAFPNAP